MTQGLSKNPDPGVVDWLPKTKILILGLWIGVYNKHKS